MQHAYFATIGVGIILMTTACSRSWVDDELQRLPPEKKVEKASVIALTRWDRSDSTLKCIISEILKQAPNTAFHYRVGDEVRSQQQQIRDNTDYGEGEVLFFTGSPAQLRYAAAIHHERITTFGDMPVSTLRGLIGTAK
jgi:hypothetical protein